MEENDKEKKEEEEVELVEEEKGKTIRRRLGDMERWRERRER